MLVLFSAALQIVCDRLAAPSVAAAEDDCKALLFPACRCVLTTKCKQQLGEWQRRWLLCNQAVPLTKIPWLWTEPDYHNYRGRGLLWHLSYKHTWHFHLQLSNVGLSSSAKPSLIAALSCVHFLMVWIIFLSLLMLNVLVLAGNIKTRSVSRQACLGLQQKSSLLYETYMMYETCLS